MTPGVADKTDEPKFTVTVGGRTYRTVIESAPIARRHEWPEPVVKVFPGGRQRYEYHCTLAQADRIYRHLREWLHKNRGDRNKEIMRTRTSVTRDVNRISYY